MRSHLLILLLLAAPTIARSQAAVSPIAVGTAVSHPGTTVYGELKIAPGSDSAYSISVAVIQGTRPGKVVAFVAGAHGTEYTSVVAASQLIARIDPTKLAGTVIVVPLVNVPSFDQMIVHVNPTDRKGMNNGFPGDPKGTQSQRGVAMVADQVVRPADVVVDLHGGDLDEDLRPYSYWTRIGNPAKDSAMKELVMAFGLDHIIVRDAGAVDRTLGGYSISQGKLSIVSEAGRSGQVLPVDLDALVNGCLNVLGSLHMIDRKVRGVSHPVFITAGTRLRATVSAMWYPVVARDTRVKKDQLLGYTTDYVGRRTAEFKSPVEGLVTFIRTVPSAPRGATLVNVADVLSVVPPWKGTGP